MEVLTEENWEETMTFIKENIKRSGFVLGNIELNSITYIHRKNQEIVALCNIYLSMYCTYFVKQGLAEQDIEQIVIKMQEYEHRGGTVIGNYEHIFKKYYKLPKNSQNEVATLVDSSIKFKKNTNVRYLTNEDADKYFYAINSIEEFKAVQINDVLNNLKNAKMVGYFIDGELVAASTLSAISNMTAVVTGVFTIKEARGHGYARSTLEYLLADYAEGKTISIFFSNPIAKKIYLELGFKVDENLIMFDEKIQDQN